MAPIARRFWYRVQIEGTTVRTAADSPVIINEALGSITRVCEFELAQRPATTPAEGQSVVVDWVDITNSVYYTIFAGTINSIEVDSQPWNMVIRCTGQLAKLRRARVSTDLNLTGMTDGEAWQAVADFCGVDYDPTDIADAGYELGALQEILWHEDTPGYQIIQELDTVFGMATMEIGPDRVIRIPYDLVPDNPAHTYTVIERAASEVFQSHHRSHGDRDAIQNLWTVRGVTVTDADKCTRTPWAHASGFNAQLGTRVRVQRQDFQSDLIQDEALAEAIVRRLMRENNRLPDDGSIDMEQDPNLHPGMQIEIRDTTYGMGSSRLVCITAVDRTGPDMAVSFTAGPPGDEGGVTTGVDRVCNDTHNDDDIPGDFPGFPEPDFPAPDLGDLPTFDMPGIPGFNLDWYTYNNPGGGGGGGGGEPPATADDLLAPAWVPFWDTSDNAPWGEAGTGAWAFDGSTGEATIAACDGAHNGWGAQASLLVTGAAANLEAWTCHAKGTSTLDSGMFYLQVTDNDNLAGYIQSVSLEFGSGIGEDTEFITDTDSDLAASVVLSSGTQFQVTITKENDTFTALIEQPVGVTKYAHTLDNVGWATNASSGDLYVSIVAFSDGNVPGDCGGGSLVLTELGLVAGAAEQQWESEFGSWDIAGGNLTESSGFGHARYIGPSAGADALIPTWNQIVFESDIDLPGVFDNQEFCSIYLEDGAASVAAIEIWGPDTTDPGPGIWLYSFTNTGYLDSDSGPAAATPFHLSITWNKAGGSMEATFTGNVTRTVSGALGTVSGSVKLRIANENNGGATGTFFNTTVTVT